MNELLCFIIHNFSWIYEEWGARFVDSNVNGGDAKLVFELNPGLRLCLIRDRSQIFLDFQGLTARSQVPTDWYSFDIVRQLITGQIVDDVTMDADKAKFVRSHFPEIIAAFAPAELAETTRQLEKLARDRASRIFD